MNYFLQNIAVGFAVGLTAVSAQVIELGRAGQGTALVTDPAASKGEAVAVRVGEAKQGETNQWPLVKEPLAPGLYRCALKVRWQLPKDYDSARLALNFGVLAGDVALANFNIDWSVMDGRIGQYTTFTREFVAMKPVTPKLNLNWQIKAQPRLQKKRPVQPLKKPKLSDGNANPTDDFVKEFSKSLEAETAKSVAEFDEPVVLLDTVDIQRVADSLVVEKVWPEKVHVYPGGEANPVVVTIRNYQAQPATATVRLTMQTGLDEASAPQELPVTVPGNGTVTCRFDWKSAAREFGCGACAEVLVAGKAVHSLTNYFSVSTPIWKTSLQGSGFLTWYGRENSFPEHVEHNRHNYINVEEAFSWQPSSWTDLNPTGTHWFAGQLDAHNSRAGLQQWMSLSHSNGIKLTTYNWPTASGAAGFEWARRHPDLVCHDPVGMGKNYDVEDFRLNDLTAARPEFWRLRQGTWHYIWVNLDLLRVIGMGVDEIINSAKTFGWDGVRFDNPPGWGTPWGADDVHAEFRQMGVTNLMKQLLPEFYDNTSGIWSNAATSARNIRYLRHRLTTEVGTNFSISYNFGLPDKDIIYGDVRTNNALFAEACKPGGQIMDEAIRNSRSWKGYQEESLKQAGAARRCGGFHECFPAEQASFRSYSAIFTFAAGSHPYTDYGWGGVLAGRYTAFMTRYGEYLWDNAFTPIAPDDFTVAEEFLWKPYLRARQLAGKTQTVVQLITPPQNDDCAPNPGTSTPWATGVTVHKRGTAKPTVWRLCAEPDVQCEKIDAQPDGDGFTVTVPAHRLWTILVWEEPAYNPPALPAPPPAPPVEKTEAKPRPAKNLNDPGPTSVAPWQASLLPRAYVFEGLWSEYFRIEPALHQAGIPATTVTACAFPREDAGWEKDAVIVLANVDTLLLKPSRMERIKNFVANGGGLVVLGGECAFERGGYTNTPLAEILPVTMKPEYMIPAYPKGLTLKRAPGATWLPAFTGNAAAFFVQTLVPKPDATVQMLAGELPAIISGNYGKGRVVAVALSSTGEGPNAFWDWPEWPKLLGQAIDWAAGARPLNIAVGNSVAPLTADELNDFSLGLKTPKDLLARAKAQPRAEVAEALFTVADAGKLTLAQLLPVLVPYAKPEWGTRLAERTEALNPNREDRLAALVLLGATRWPAATLRLLAVLAQPETKVPALEGLGLTGDAKAIPAIRETYDKAIRAALLPGETEWFNPGEFAMTHAEVATAAALALYRLGEATGLERVLTMHRHVQLYLRVYNNAGHRELRNWSDPIGLAWLKAMYEHSDHLAAALGKFQQHTGAVPAAQLPVFVKMAATATEPADVEWLAGELEASLPALPPATWQSLTTAKDGIIARLARSATAAKPAQP